MSRVPFLTNTPFMNHQFPIQSPTSNLPINLLPFDPELSSFSESVTSPIQRSYPSSQQANLSVSPKSLKCFEILKLCNTVSENLTKNIGNQKDSNIQKKEFQEIKQKQEFIRLLQDIIWEVQEDEVIKKFESLSKQNYFSKNNISTELIDSL